MSVTALQVESLPSGADSIRAWLDDLDRVLDRATGLDVGVDDAGLVEATRRLGRAGSRIDAVRLAVVAEADRRSAARRVTGATTTAAWLRADGMSAGAAGRQVALAGSLAEHEADQGGAGGRGDQPGAGPGHHRGAGRAVRAVADVDKAAVEAAAAGRRGPAGPRSATQGRARAGGPGRSGRLGGPGRPGTGREGRPGAFLLARPGRDASPARGLRHRGRRHPGRRPGPAGRAQPRR